MILTGILCLFLMILIFIQVLARYVFQMPIRWSDIVSRILLAYIGMGGSTIMFYRKREPRIQFLYNKLSPKRRSQLEIFVNLISLIFCIVLLIPVRDVLVPATAGKLPFLPLTWFHLLIAFPICMFLICLILLHNIIQNWTKLNMD